MNLLWPSDLLLSHRICFCSGSDLKLWVAQDRVFEDKAKMVSEAIDLFKKYVNFEAEVIEATLSSA